MCACGKTHRDTYKHRESGGGHLLDFQELKLKAVINTLHKCKG